MNCIRPSFMAVFFVVRMIHLLQKPHFSNLVENMFAYIVRCDDFIEISSSPLTEHLFCDMINYTKEHLFCFFGGAIMGQVYMCIDLKSFYASVECVARGYDPFKVPLVVADPTRGDGAITLAIRRWVSRTAVVYLRYPSTYNTR